MSFSYERFSNNAITTLAESIDSDDSVVHVDDHSAFPAQAPFRIIVGGEVMRVTSTTGAYFTVERGVENTTAIPHTSGDTVAHILTKESFINAFEVNSIQDFRLSFSPTEPVQNIGSGSLVYLTGFRGSKVALLDVTDARWRLSSIGSGNYLDISGYGSGVVVDVFAYYDNTNLSVKIHGEAWTNSTTRASGLSVVDGVDVMSVDNSYRYLGSVQMESAGYSLSTPSRRRLWNRNNQVPLALNKLVNSTSYTYAFATPRPANNSLENSVQFLIGQSGVSPVEAQVSLGVYSINNGPYIYSVGLGIDQAVVINSNQIGGGWGYYGPVQVIGGHFDNPDKGNHTWTLMEAGQTSITTTVYGNDDSTYRNGIVGKIWS